MDVRSYERERVVPIQNETISSPKKAPTHTSEPAPAHLNISRERERVVIGNNAVKDCRSHTELMVSVTPNAPVRLGCRKSSRDLLSAALSGRPSHSRVGGE